MQGQFLWRVKTSTWVWFKAQSLLKALCVQFARILAQTESIWQAFLLHMLQFCKWFMFWCTIPCLFSTASWILLQLQICPRLPMNFWLARQDRIENITLFHNLPGFKTSILGFTRFVLLESRDLLFLDSQDLASWCQVICSWIHKICLLGV
jgi:hypothetical protein